MDIFFWIIDPIIPLTMIILGLVFLYNPPKEINIVYGHRTARSMKSREAWNFAHHRCGQVWAAVGSILLPAIIISKLIVPIPKEYLSMIHAGIGITAMIIPIPIVERELKTRF